MILGACQDIAKLIALSSISLDSCGRGLASILRHELPVAKVQPSMKNCAMQVQSNALAALEALDCDVAEQILSSGCVTGDRINGLCDGETGKW